MLLTMENEWRVPDRRDYSRMLNQFKWAQHAEGKLRCLKGLVADFKATNPDGAMPAGLEPEVISTPRTTGHPHRALPTPSPA